MTNVADEFPHLSTLDPIKLVERAEEIKRDLRELKPDDAPEDLQIAKLRELSQIAGILRRRSSPASAAKKKTTSKRAPAPTVDSVL
jgi:hypothetical protein